MDDQKSLFPTISKVFLAIMIFTAIIVSGYQIINQQKMPNNETIQPNNQEAENYYNLLEKKCTGSSCCLSSLKLMEENNYKETDKDYKCPNGFKANGLKCESSLSWCEPIKENLKILLEPKNIALFKKEIPNANNQCVSHPQVVSYSLNTVDDRFSLMKINSRQLEKNQDAIKNIINFVEKGEIPKKIIKVSKPSGVVGEKQIVEEERQGVGYLYYDAFHNSCGGFMIDLIGKIEDISYPGTDGARAIYVWEGQDIPGLIRVRIYAYYKDYVIELSKLVSDEDYLMNIVKKCEKSSKEQCFSKTVASDKILKQKAKETAEELVELFELNNQPDTSDWQTYRNEEFGFEMKYSEDQLSSYHKNPGFLNNKITIKSVDDTKKDFEAMIEAISSEIPETMKLPKMMNRKIEILSEASDCSYPENFKNDIKEVSDQLRKGIGKTAKVEGIYNDNLKKCGIKIIDNEGYSIIMDNYRYTAQFLLEDDQIITFSFSLFPENVFKDIDKFLAGLSYAEYENLYSSGDIIDEEITAKIIERYDQIVSSFRFIEN